MCITFCTPQENRSYQTRGQKGGRLIYLKKVKLSIRILKNGVKKGGLSPEEAPRCTPEPRGNRGGSLNWGRATGRPETEIPEVAAKAQPAKSWNVPHAVEKTLAGPCRFLRTPKESRALPRGGGRGLLSKTAVLDLMATTAPEHESTPWDLIRCRVSKRVLHPRQQKGRFFGWFGAGWFRLYVASYHSLDVYRRTNHAKTYPVRGIPKEKRARPLTRSTWGSGLLTRFEGRYQPSWMASHRTVCLGRAKGPAVPGFCAKRG